jgi:hypothetical protein
VVVSWDDDDWNHSGRIDAQLSLLQSNGKVLCSYHSMLFTDGNAWWKFNGHSTSNLGTSFCYRKSWWADHKFQPRQIGEDLTFISDAARAGQHISTDAGLLMVASIHQGNTSPRQLQGNSWKRIEKPEIEGYCEI